MKLPDPKALRAALLPIVVRLQEARTEHERLAAEMYEIDRQLLADDVYLCEYTGERITDPKSAWMMATGEKSAAYYSKRDDIIAERYAVPERGLCPALMAESKVIELRRELIDAGSAFFPDLTYDRVSRCLDTLHECARLLEGLARTAPV